MTGVALDASSVVGIILAGGRSSRMGAEKSLLSLGGVPLIEWVTARLRGQVEKVIISANGDAERFRDCAVPIVPDIIPDLGPVGGLIAGLRWSQSVGARFVLTAACDTPFFPTDLAARLAKAIAGNPSGTAVARSNGHDHYTFTLQPVACADELESWLGPPEHRSLHDWLKGRQPVSVSFEGDPDPFFNINAPMDLVQAETWARDFEKFSGKRTA
jgi:molybdopterin-guanine dinucleotide biosynthesis protein A